MDPITTMLTIGEFVNNALSNRQAIRDQARAYQTYLGAIKADQKRWDDRYGQVEKMVMALVGAPESAADQFQREMAERRIGDKTVGQLVKGISQDYQAAKATSEAAIAGAGLNSSGATAVTQARLGEATIAAGAEARLQGIMEGRRTLIDTLRSGGPRPSLAPALATDPRLTMSNQMTLDTYPLLRGSRSVFEGLWGKKPSGKPVPYSTGGYLG